MNDPAPRYVVAVDVGQAHDYTAVAILQSYRVREAVDDKVREDRRHDLVHLERFRDISYPEQVRRLTERYREVERIAKVEHREASVQLVVDATGVGKPVLDLMREAKLRPRGVIITGGETASHTDGISRVPKRELVTTLQVALQTRRLVVAEDLPLAETFLKEMRGFRVKISLTGHASFGNDVGAWREADHDDLVLAVALGVWKLEGPKVASRSYLKAAMGFA
jgi:hypothetical protein